LRSEARIDRAANLIDWPPRAMVCPLDISAVERETD